MISLLKKRRPVRYYRSCESLSIYLFHKIMETFDYRFLVIGWDEISEITFDEQQAIQTWGGIYNEYCKLSSNNRAIDYYRTAQKLGYLKTRKEVGVRILIQLTIRNMKKSVFVGYLDALRNLDFKYEGDEKDADKLSDLSRQVRACDNEIGLLEDKLKKMVRSGEAIPFQKELVKVEQALGRNMIDPKKTSVTKWVFLIEEIKELAENRKQQLAKNGRK